MHDEELLSRMEHTLQKVFGSPATAFIDDPDLRPPPHKRAVRHVPQQLQDDQFQLPPSITQQPVPSQQHLQSQPAQAQQQQPTQTQQQKHQVEFPSTSTIADLLNNLNAAPTAPRLNFTPELTFPAQLPSGSETWARLLAAGANGMSPLSSLDEVFVEVFADKVASKVITALTPQIQQIRTAIIGLARLVEMNQAASAATTLIEKRVQTPPTPQNQDISAPIINTTNISTNPTAPSATATVTTTATTTKKRNPSPSKSEVPVAAATASAVNVSPTNENEAPTTSLITKVATTQSAANTTIKPNGPTSTKTERKTGEGKSNPKRTVKEVPDVYRIIKLDDLGDHFNMNEKLCLLCRETFTESHLHSVKRHMYRKHRGELDTVLQRKTNDAVAVATTERPALIGNSIDQAITIIKNELNDKDSNDSNELIDVVQVSM